MVNQNARQEKLVNFTGCCKKGAKKPKLTCTKNIYPKHEEFTQKINTYSNTEVAEALKKLSFCAQTKTYLFWNKTVVVERRFLVKVISFG